jgi:hypothetical protein
MTRIDQTSKEQLVYSIEDEPIVLSKSLIDLLLKQTNPAELISLYCFYYYTAKWQKTNKPKATDNYCMCGLNWGYDKFKEAKKGLLSLRLIEKIQLREKGKIKEWFIKVNFIWKNNTLNQNWEKPDQGKTRTGKQKINALSNSNINALSNSNNSPKKNIPKISFQEKIKSYLPLAKQLYKIIVTKKHIKFTPKQIQNWANDIRPLIETQKVSIKRIIIALNFYSEHIGEDYIPVIESGRSLRDKFVKLENAMKRNGYKKEIKSTITIGSRRSGDVVHYRDADIVIN